MFVLLFMLVIVAVFMAIVLGLLTAARHLGGRLAAKLMGFALIALSFAGSMSLVSDCDRDPTYIPPACSDEARCGIGTMVFACDGPTGAMSYGLAYFGFPILALVIAFLTFRVVRRAPQPVKEF